MDLEEGELLISDSPGSSNDGDNRYRSMRKERTCRDTSSVLIRHGKFKVKHASSTSFKRDGHKCDNRNVCRKTFRGRDCLSRSQRIKSDGHPVIDLSSSEERRRRRRRISKSGSVPYIIDSNIDSNSRCLKSKKRKSRTQRTDCVERRFEQLQPKAMSYNKTVLRKKVISKSGPRSVSSATSKLPENYSLMNKLITAGLAKKSSTSYNDKVQDRSLVVSLSNTSHTKNEELITSVADVNDEDDNEIEVIVPPKKKPTVVTLDSDGEEVGKSVKEKTIIEDPPKSLNQTESLHVSNIKKSTVLEACNVSSCNKKNQDQYQLEEFSLTESLFGSSFISSDNASVKCLFSDEDSEPYSPSSPSSCNTLEPSSKRDLESPSSVLSPNSGLENNRSNNMFSSDKAQESINEEIDHPSYCKSTGLNTGDQNSSLAMASFLKNDYSSEQSVPVKESKEKKDVFNNSLCHLKNNSDEEKPYLLLESNKSFKNHSNNETSTSGELQNLADYIETSCIDYVCGLEHKLDKSCTQPLSQKLLIKSTAFSTKYISSENLHESNDACIPSSVHEFENTSKPSQMSQIEDLSIKNVCSSVCSPNYETEAECSTKDQEVYTPFTSCILRKSVNESSVGFLEKCSKKVVPVDLCEETINEQTVHSSPCSQIGISSLSSDPLAIHASKYKEDCELNKFDDLESIAAKYDGSTILQDSEGCLIKKINIPDEENITHDCVRHEDGVLNENNINVNSDDEDYLSQLRLIALSTKGKTINSSTLNKESNGFKENISHSNTSADDDDYDNEEEDVLQLRVAALKSAVMKKHEERKKRGLFIKKRKQESSGLADDIFHLPSALEKLYNQDSHSESNVLSSKQETVPPASPAFSTASLQDAEDMELANSDSGGDIIQDVCVQEKLVVNDHTVECLESANLANVTKPYFSSQQASQNKTLNMFPTNVSSLILPQPLPPGVEAGSSGCFSGQSQNYTNSTPFPNILTPPSTFVFPFLPPPPPPPPISTEPQLQLYKPHTVSNNEQFQTHFNTPISCVLSETKLLPPVSPQSEPCVGVHEDKNPINTQSENTNTNIRYETRSNKQSEVNTQNIKFPSSGCRVHFNKCAAANHPDCTRVQLRQNLRSIPLIKNGPKKTLTSKLSRKIRKKFKKNNLCNEMLTPDPKVLCITNSCIPSAQKAKFSLNTQTQHNLPICTTDSLVEKSRHVSPHKQDTLTQLCTTDSLATSSWTEHDNNYKETLYNKCTNSIKVCRKPYDFRYEESSSPQGKALIQGEEMDLSEMIVLDEVGMSPEHKPCYGQNSDQNFEREEEENEATLRVRALTSLTAKPVPVINPSTYDNHLSQTNSRTETSNQYHKKNKSVGKTFIGGGAYNFRNKTKDFENISVTRRVDVSDSKYRLTRVVMNEPRRSVVHGRESLKVVIPSESPPLMPSQPSPPLVERLVINVGEDSDSEEDCEWMRRVRIQDSVAPTLSVPSVDHELERSIDLLLMNARQNIENGPLSKSVQLKDASKSGSNILNITPKSKRKHENYTCDTPLQLLPKERQEEYRRLQKIIEQKEKEKEMQQQSKKVVFIKQMNKSISPLQGVMANEAKTLSQGVVENCKITKMDKKGNLSDITSETKTQNNQIRIVKKKQDRTFHLPSKSLEKPENYKNDYIQKDMKQNSESKNITKKPSQIDRSDSTKEDSSHQTPSQTRQEPLVELCGQHSKTENIPQFKSNGKKFLSECLGSHTTEKVQTISEKQFKLIDKTITKNRDLSNRCNTSYPTILLDKVKDKNLDVSIKNKQDEPSSFVKDMKKDLEPSNKCMPYHKENVIKPEESVNTLHLDVEEINSSASEHLEKTTNFTDLKHNESQKKLVQPSITIENYFKDEDSDITDNIVNKDSENCMTKIQISGSNISEVSNIKDLEVVVLGTTPTNLDNSALSCDTSLNQLDKFIARDTVSKEIRHAVLDKGLSSGECLVLSDLNKVHGSELDSPSASKQSLQSSGVLASAQDLEVLVSQQSELICERFMMINELSEMSESLGELEREQTQLDKVVEEINRLRKALIQAEKNLNEQHSVTSRLEQSLHTTQQAIHKRHLHIKYLETSCHHLGYKLKKSDYQIPTTGKDIMAKKIEQVTEKQEKIKIKRERINKLMYNPNSRKESVADYHALESIKNQESVPKYSCVQMKSSVLQQRENNTTSLHTSFCQPGYPISDALIIGETADLNMTSMPSAMDAAVEQSLEVYCQSPVPKITSTELLDKLQSSENVNKSQRLLETLNKFDKQVVGQQYTSVTSSENKLLEERTSIKRPLSQVVGDFEDISSTKRINYTKHKTTLNTLSKVVSENDLLQGCDEDHTEKSHVPKSIISNESSKTTLSKPTKSILQYKSILQCKTTTKRMEQSSSSGKTIVCPFDLTGICQDSQCMFQHLQSRS